MRKEYVWARIMVLAGLLIVGSLFAARTLLSEDPEVSGQDPPRVLILPGVLLLLFMLEVITSRRRFRINNAQPSHHEK